MGDHGAALALHLEGQRLLEAEGAGGPSRSPLADQHGSRLRRLFQAGRDVHGVAGDDLLAGSADRGDHLARVDADPDRQRDAVVGLEGAIELVEVLKHLERCADRPLRIVFVGCRDSEDRDDRIADVLLERSAPRWMTFDIASK